MFLNTLLSSWIWLSRQHLFILFVKSWPQFIYKTDGRYFDERFRNFCQVNVIMFVYLCFRREVFENVFHELEDANEGKGFWGHLKDVEGKGLGFVDALVLSKCYSLLLNKDSFHLVQPVKYQSMWRSQLVRLPQLNQLFQRLLILSMRQLKT